MAPSRLRLWLFILSPRDGFRLQVLGRICRNQLECFLLILRFDSPGSGYLEVLHECFTSFLPVRIVLSSGNLLNCCKNLWVKAALERSMENMHGLDIKRSC